MRVSDLEVGDRFLDSDGCLCIYLGFEKEFKERKHCNFINLADQVFEATQTTVGPQETYMCFYKNSWCHFKIRPGMKVFPIGEKAKGLCRKLSSGFVEKWDHDCQEDLRSEPSPHDCCTCGEYEASATMGGHEQHDKSCNYVTLINEFHRINGA